MTVDVFQATKKMKTLQSVAPDGNHSNLLSLELGDLYCYKGSKIWKNIYISLENTFYWQPWCVLSQPPHASSQNSHTNTYIVINTPPPRNSLSHHPSCHGWRQIQTPTQLNTPFKHSRRPWISTEQDWANTVRNFLSVRMRRNKVTNSLWAPDAPVLSAKDT